MSGFDNPYSTTVTVSANYTVAPTDYVILATGSPTITLPVPATGAESFSVATPTVPTGSIGRHLEIRNVGAGTVTVAAPAGGSQVDAGASFTLATGVHGAILVSDGAAWWSVSRV